ncbi:PepSY domain-containing protein [Bacillus sp. 1P06AnD]|uniref:PepSY domain-containing protein n=1 Tax=Bacillus sp. 1P06AnD TaxID=3132208 RepID=UPI0039A2AF4B
MKGIAYTLTSLAVALTMAGCSDDGDTGNKSAAGGTHHENHTAGTNSHKTHTTDLESADLNMSIEDAMAIAKMKSEGDFTKIELSKDGKRYVYEVEMMTNTTETELKIDANTKQVIKQDSDNLDTDEIGTEHANKMMSLEKLIEPEEAISIAKKKVPGTVTSWELQRKGDKTVYEIDIIDQTNFERQVMVDATSKSILNVKDD